MIGARSKPGDPLTDRQAEVHGFMLDYQKANGKPPTVREISVGMGIKSPCGVQGHLKALARKGVVTVGPETESRRFKAVEPYKPPSLGICAIVLNACAWKGVESWQVVEGKVNDGEGRVYDLEEARAVVFYLDHAPKPEAAR